MPTLVAACFHCRLLHCRRTRRSLRRRRAIRCCRPDRLPAASDASQLPTRLHLCSTRWPLNTTRWHLWVPAALLYLAPLLLRRRRAAIRRRAAAVHRRPLGLERLKAADQAARVPLMPQHL